jgi:hypothetical protein
MLIRPMASGIQMHVIRTTFSMHFFGDCPAESPHVWAPSKQNLPRKMAGHTDSSKRMLMCNQYCEFEKDNQQHCFVESLTTGAFIPVLSGPGPLEQHTYPFPSKCTQLQAAE